MGAGSMVAGTVLRVARPAADLDAAVRFHGDRPGQPDRADYNTAVARLKRRGISPVPSDNPYRDRCGITVEHPDGFRVAPANRAPPY